MRKLSVILLLVLLAAWTAAAFGEDTDDYVPGKYRTWDVNWTAGEIEQEDGDIEYEARFTDGSLAEVEVELEQEDDTEYEVVYDRNGNIIRAEYETDDDEIYYDGSVWTDGDGNEVSGPDLSFMKKYFDDFDLERSCYPDNTMSLVGLSLREMYPELTNRWYQIVPVDLTQDGEYTYKLAVSNMYYMGRCKVTVQDGKVTVDYEIPYGDIRIGKQCVAWFRNIGEITTDFLEDPQSHFRFGQPADIQEDLGGQETALLFICNRVSFEMPLRGVDTCLKRFYTGGETMRAYRQELLELLAKTE